MFKSLAQLGAQHYQRPCAGVGLTCIVLEPHLCATVSLLLQTAICDMLHCTGGTRSRQECYSPNLPIAHVLQMQL